MSGPEYIPPGTPISNKRNKPARRRKKGESWAEIEPIQPINIRLGLSRSERDNWIRNAILDQCRRFSKAGMQVKTPDFVKYVAGAKHNEVRRILLGLVFSGDIDADGLVDPETFKMVDRYTLWSPRLYDGSERRIDRVFFRGDLVTCYYLAKLPENKHGLSSQDLRKRILGNNWTAEMALAVPRKVERTRKASTSGTQHQLVTNAGKGSGSVPNFVTDFESKTDVLP
jgi:hypothetical protein